MRRVVLAVVCIVAGLVLLLSFKTHPTTAAAAAPPSAVSPSGQSSESGRPGARTVTGDAADTRFGPVQVRITLAGGRVTKVTAVEYPTAQPRDAEINAYAIPVLDREAGQAGDADLDMVSGATYTSQGYLESLQSALDKAGLR